jgi:hypothetical protein
MPCNASYTRFIFIMFFICTIIWYAFLYALLFAQNLILVKSGCYIIFCCWWRPDFALLFSKHAQSPCIVVIWFHTHSLPRPSWWSSYLFFPTTILLISICIVFSHGAKSRTINYYAENNWFVLLEQFNHIARTMDLFVWNNWYAFLESLWFYRKLDGNPCDAVRF